MSSCGADVEAMVSRIDDVTAAIREILSEDPAEMLAQRRAREEHQQREHEQRSKAKLERVKMRYEPKFYSRFERDDLIDALLKEVDDSGGIKRGCCGKSSALGSNAPASAPIDLSLYAKSEKISVEEAQKLKGEAAISVQRADWERAESQYTSAIKLLTGIAEGDEPLEQLLTVLHNNRSLVYNKLGNYMSAVEDATRVLRREPSNVKALLRRATALRRMHRPVEAMKDVTEVLKREPRNAEALQQQQWLEKAESELAESELFVEEETRKAAGGNTASQSNAAQQLCSAIDVIRNHQPPPSDSEVLTAGLEEVAQALLTVSRVLNRHLTGAAVLFAVRGGVTPTVNLALWALSAVSLDTNQLARQLRQEALRAVLQQVLAVLSVVIELSEVALQEADPALMDVLIAKVVGVIAASLSGDALADTLVSGTACSALVCLGQLAKGYPTTVVAALGDSLTSDLLVKLFHLAVSSPTLFYAYLGLLDVLMDSTTLSRPMAEKLDKVLFTMVSHPSRSEAKTTKTKPTPNPLVLATAEVALLGHGSAGSWTGASTATAATVRLQALRFVLRLTCFAASPICVSASRRDCITMFVCSHRFARELHALAVAALGRASSKGSAAKELDALYAVVYNVILTAPDRQRYLEETWLSADLVPSLVSLTLEFLLAQPTPKEGEGSFLFSPACVNMLATLSKLCPSRVPIAEGSNTLLVEETVQWLAKSEPTLWAWLEAATESISGQSASTAEGKAVQLSQSLAEHLLTLLGYLSIQRKGLPSKSPLFLQFSTEIEGGGGGTVPRALDSLFICVREGKCFTEASVVALAEGGRATPAVTPLVLLGSAALLLSSVLEPFPSHSVCYRELVKHKAIDVLLGALRDARTSLLMLKHEAAKGENSAVKSTLDLWIQHTAQTQQNLCIAIGKVCAVQGSAAEHHNGDGDSLLDRLHQLNGFETLAAAFNKK